MTKNAQLKDQKLKKLDPRAYIRYLVRYDSTNIFRIWIPHQGKVISTRDVLFDKHTFFNGKSEISAEAIPEVDSLLAYITLLESHAAKESILKEEEILDPP